MSLEAYEDFAYDAYFCDREDPAASNRRRSAARSISFDWQFALTGLESSGVKKRN